MSPLNTTLTIEIDGRNIPLWRQKAVYLFARLLRVRVVLHEKTVYVRPSNENNP